MRAEPDTSSWQGGTLLELTAVGGRGGGGRVFFILAGLFHTDSLQRPLFVRGSGIELLC